MQRDTRIRLLLAATALLISHQALAGRWDYEPYLTASVRYNDNPALVPSVQNPQSTLATLALVAADITRNAPGSTLSLSPRIQQTYYPDKDFRDLNTTDYFLRGAYTHNEPLYNIGTGFSYDYQSVLSSEDSDPGDPGDSGSGNFLRVDDKRLRYTLSPNITWLPSVRDTLLASVAFSRVDHKLDFTNRSDVDSVSGTVSYQRAVTPRQSVGLILTAYTSASDRKGFVTLCADGSLPVTCTPVSPDLNEAKFTNDADGNSYSLSYRFQWSEKTSLSASYGTQKTNIESGIFVPVDQLVNKATFKSTQYQLGLSNAAERYEFELNASRGVSPSSDGSPSDKIQLQTSFTYRVTPKLTAKIAALGYDQNSKSAFVSRTTQYLRTDLVTSWNLDRNWSISATYIFRNRDPRVVNSGTGPVGTTDNLRRRSNAITISTRYRFL